MGVSNWPSQSSTRRTVAVDDARRLPSVAALHATVPDLAGAAGLLSTDTIAPVRRVGVGG